MTDQSPVAHRELARSLLGQKKYAEAVKEAKYAYYHCSNTPDNLKLLEEAISKAKQAAPTQARK